jgi:hypothetical protein
MVRREWGCACVRSCHGVTDRVAASSPRLSPSLPPLLPAATMYQRPEKASAYAELRRHLLLLGAWVGAVRVSTYVLHYMNQ